MKYDQAFRDGGYEMAIMTSYEFDPVVFEGVVLRSLATAGVRDVTVIVDMDRANIQFTEYGPPKRAGRQYHLAKRKVTGCFHPKLVLQAGEKKARLMVGSANLTGSGLMGNLEAVTSIVAQEDDLWAAPLIRSARDYLERHISTSDRAGRAALLRFDAKTEWMNDVEPALVVEDPQGHRHGLLYENVDDSIADQFLTLIGDDHIHKMVMISPFWNGNLGAVADLMGALAHPETSLVLNPSNHPIAVDRLEALGCSIHDANLIPEAAGRRLHAKILVACGTRADYIMTGSANMTREGLYSRSGGPGNAEMGLVRTEGPGTVLERLSLTDVLSNRLDISNHPPQKNADVADLVIDAPRDGGSLEVHLGYLTWVPPSDVSPQDCKISLFGMGDAELGVLEPICEGQRFIMAVGQLTEQPRRGRVIFPDGVSSAVIPIADVEGLARLQHGRMPAAQTKLLIELGDVRQFDVHALELATRLRAMVDAEQNKRSEKFSGRRAGGAAGQGKDHSEGENAKPLSRDAFLGIKTLREIEMEEMGYRYSAMGEVRRMLASALGLGFETHILDEDEDVAVEDLMPNEEGLIDDPEDDEEAAPPEGSQPPENKKKKTPPRRRRKSERKGGASIARLEVQLSKCIMQMREEIDEEVVDILSMRNSISLQMVVLATLNEASPVGETPSPSHPMPARGTTRSSGWITLLGGLVGACRDKLPASAALKHRLDRERIECLSTLLFAGGILADAAKQAKLPDGVHKSFQELHADLARIIQHAFSGKPEAAAYLSKVLLSLEKVYNEGQEQGPEVLAAQ